MYRAFFGACQVLVWVWLVPFGAAGQGVVAPTNAAAMPEAKPVPLDYKTIITLLAGEEMFGRGYVRQGQEKASEYLQAQFRLLGLQPLPSLAGYGQGFTHKVNVVEKEPRLRLNNKRLNPGTDFIPDAESAPVKVGGLFNSRRKARMYTYLPEDSALFFKEVIKSAPWAASGRRKAACISIPESWYRPIAKQLVARPPACVFLQAGGKLTATLSDNVLPFGLIHLAQGFAPKNGHRVKCRYRVQVAKEINSENVVAMVPGTAVPDSFLIFTAHYDHLGGLGQRVYFPGANDNASGTAMLLALAAERVKNPARYTTVFIAFAAEEAGLRGSQYFVQAPPLDLKRIRFLLNMDLFGSGEYGATLVNAPAVQPDFDRLQAMNTQLAALPRLKPRRNAPNSDHYPFAVAGVPCMFMYLEGPFKAYHDVYDRPENLSLFGFRPAFLLLDGFMR